MYPCGEGAWNGGGGEVGSEGETPRYGGLVVYDGGYWVEPSEFWRVNPGVWEIASVEGVKDMGAGL